MKYYFLFLIMLTFLSCEAFTGGPLIQERERFQNHQVQIEEAPGSALSYLTDNCIPLSLDQDLEIPAQTFPNSRIILLGEDHYNSDMRSLNMSFIRYMREELGIRYYVAEMNWVQSEYINEYILGGDIAALDVVMDHAIQNGAALATQETYQFFQALRQYNDELTPPEKIIICGVDVFDPWEDSPIRLRQYFPDSSTPIPSEIEAEIEAVNTAQSCHYINYDLLLDSIEDHREAYENYLGEFFPWFLHGIRCRRNALEKTIASASTNGDNWLNHRDWAIYNNVLSLLEILPPQERLFGSWGGAHVLQGTYRFPVGRNSGEFKPYTTWSAWYRSEAASIYGDITSIYIAPVDCENPEADMEMGFLLEYFNLSDMDPRLTHYFQQAAERNGCSHALFPLDRDGSPYRNGLYGVPNPLSGGVTTDYFQYVLYVKGSRSMVPLQ